MAQFGCPTKVTLASSCVSRDILPDIETEEDRLELVEEESQDEGPLAERNDATLAEPLLLKTAHDEPVGEIEIEPQFTVVQAGVHREDEPDHNTTWPQSDDINFELINLPRKLPVLTPIYNARKKAK